MIVAQLGTVYLEVTRNVLVTAERAVAVLSPRALVFGLQPMTVTGF